MSPDEAVEKTGPPGDLHVVSPAQPPLCIAALQYK